MEQEERRKKERKTRMRLDRVHGIMFEAGFNIICDDNLIIDMVSENMAEKLGYVVEELIGKNLFLLLPAGREEVARVLDFAKQSKEGGNVFLKNFFMEHKIDKREPLPFDATFKKIFHFRDSSIVTMNFFDVSERKEAEDDLRAETRRDELTGLYSWKEFRSRAEEVIAATCLLDETVSLFLFDMDDLHGYNRDYSHHTGDVGIKALASAIKASIRHEADRDENIIRMSDLAGRKSDKADEDIILVIGKLDLDVLRRRVEINVHKFCHEMSCPHFSFSVGVSYYTPSRERFSVGDIFVRLCQEADAMMYDEKRIKNEEHD